MSVRKHFTQAILLQRIIDHVKVPSVMLCCKRLCTLVGPTYSNHYVGGPANYNGSLGLHAFTSQNRETKMIFRHPAWLIDPSPLNSWQRDTSIPMMGPMLSDGRPYSKTDHRKKISQLSFHTTSLSCLASILRIDLSSFSPFPSQAVSSLHWLHKPKRLIQSWLETVKQRLWPQLQQRLLRSQMWSLLIACLQRLDTQSKMGSSNWRLRMWRCRTYEPISMMIFASVIFCLGSIWQSKPTLFPWHPIVS